MRVQNCPKGSGGKMLLLGGAAPLSSQKTGYLLRTAHMIPIIFFAKMCLRTALRGAPLNAFGCLASLLNAWEQF